MKVMAIDIGGSSIRSAVIDPAELPRRPEATIIATPSEISAIPDVVSSLIDRHGPCDAIGVGCAGVVDPISGVWRWMPHAAGRDIPIGAALLERFGVPVAVDNDANMAVLAEARRGSGRGERSVLMVLLGTGIGAGWANDGEIERGRCGAWGEVGHMQLADAPRCACGADGCWEALVSGRVLDAGARRVLGPAARGVELMEAAGAGEVEAINEIDEFGRWLAVGLGNLMATLDPDVVVLGGGVMDSADPLVRAAERHLADRQGVLRVTGLPPIRPAWFGSLAGLVGAALAAEEMTR